LVALATFITKSEIAEASPIVACTVAGADDIAGQTRRASIADATQIRVDELSIHTRKLA